MANYDLIYPGQTIDQLLTTAYYLKNAGYIFLGSASSYSGTPSQRAWLIAPSGFTGFGFSEAIPIGSMGICLYNGTSWSGVTINVVTVDETMTAGSDNPISSGAVYDVLSTITQGISAQLDSLELADATDPSDILDVLTVALKMTRGGFDVVVSSLDILSATASKAGLMSAADKIKLDGFVNNIRSLVFADTTPSSDLGTKIVESLKWTVDNVQEVITTLTLLAASTEKAGLMSAADKAYVDGLPTTLGNLASALQDMLASILSIVFDDTTPSSDKANKIVETMKWTSGGIQRAITTLTLLAASSEKAGLMSASDKAYVDGLPATLTSLSNSISSIETDLLNYYTKEQTYSKTEVDTLLDGKQNVIDDLASIRSGAAAGATAVQPAAMNSAISSVRASIGYYECSTAAGTAAKTVSASGYTLTNGGCIRIKMTNANTANNVTLNINSTGAKALYYDGAQASSSNTWEAGEVLEVYYDGTQYQCASGGGGGKFATGQKVKEVGITDELDNSHNLIESAPLNAILNDAINIGTWVIGSLGTNHEYYSMTGRIEACANIKNAVVKYTVQSGYALSIHEYSGEYTSLSDVVGSTWIRQSSSWLEGTGTYTPSNQTKTLVLILSKTPTSSMLSIQPSDASNLSVQYNTRMTLDNMREMLTEHDAEIDILEDAVMLNGNIDAAWYQGTLRVTHAYSNSGDPAPQRIITTIPAQTKFTFTVASGYSISIHEYSAVFANPTQITDGSSWIGTLGTWNEGTFEYTPSSSCKTVVVIMRKGNGTSNILPTEGSNFTGSFISSVKHSVESLQYDMEVVDTVLNGTYTEGGAYTPTWYQGTLGDNHTYVASGGNAAKRIICTVPRTNLLTVNVTSGYWASVHEYSEVFANAAAITNGSSWLGNTHGWFDGSMDITPLAATKTFVVVMSKGDKNQNVSPTDGSNVSFATEGTHTVGLIEKVNNLEYDDSDSYYWGMDMIKRKCRTTYLGMLTYLQAFCKYDGKYYSTNGSNIAEQDDSFTVLRNVSINVGHGNSLQLVGNGKAWASGWDDQKMYRVDLATLTVDQTITLPTTGYTTAAVDEDNGLMYIFQRDTNPNTEAQYTFIVYDYVNEQIISTRKIETFAAMQSVDYYQGKILMLNGLATNVAPSGIRIYNTAGDVLATFDLEIFRTDEPEGIMFTRDTFKILVSNVGKELFRIE